MAPSWLLFLKMMIAFLEYYPVVYMLQVLYIFLSPSLRISHIQQKRKTCDKSNKAFVEIDYLFLARLVITPMEW